MKREISKAPHSGSLNYFTQSPVRGQLEPYDPRVNKGWPGRFLQCTETPNQLKVLLPPRTAAFYEQLLKAEATELARKPQPSWERILEIRHLKERMIRKCQKSCKASPMKRLGRGESFAFQTFIAPSDFRLKEMEKWLKQQEGRSGYPPIDISSNGGRSVINNAIRNSYCCHRCTKPGCAGVHRATSSTSSSPDSVQARLDRPVSPDSSGDDSDDDVKPDIATRSRPGATPSPPLPFPEPITQPVPSLPRTSVLSPEPLPHPYRNSLIKMDDRSGEEVTTAVEATHQGEIVEEPVPVTEPVPMTLPVIDEDHTLSDKYVPPPLRRQRSCIKRTPSGDNMKTVSWADDRDWTAQLSKYATAAKEAQDSGRQWQEVRDIYAEQITGLDALHQHVIQGLERIRLETEHLRGIEDTILAQRQKIIESCRALEAKQAEFQFKVQNALDEADHTLIVCRAKRENEVHAS